MSYRGGGGLLVDVSPGGERRAQGGVVRAMLAASGGVTCLSSDYPRQGRQYRCSMNSRHFGPRVGAYGGVVGVSPVPTSTCAGTALSMLTESGPRAVSMVRVLSVRARTLKGPL